ncbi:PCI-domain-containing protein [Thozetella sp. PMI_491]|nr:PCI-domain-containing protein [Thozetella sp. PMI_491]
MAEAKPNDPILAYFSQLGGVVVKELPKLDLELYIQNYKGRTRFDRLFVIGRSSVPLCVDALKAAVAEAKRGRDIHRYRDVIECLRLAAPNEPETTWDRQWMDATDKSNRTEVARLEAELKGYKNNLIKESVRMGNEDMGKHLEAIGDLSGAYDAYTRMRPDVSTAKHIVDLGKHLVSVSLQRRDWAMVTANLMKMTGNQSGDEEKILNAYVKIAGGIALLGRDKYDEAAASFLQADASVAHDNYNEIASPNDIAVYGGLLALATMDRNALQTQVLDNSTFRPFLELEPHIRRAVTQFVSGRYSSCLAILESYRADYMLDIYLQKHVAHIYDEIRKKCIVQYLIPFSCVTLESMNAAFAAPGFSIEAELVTMIRAGVLNARINTIDGLVTMVSVNDRLKMQQTAIQAAKGYEKEAVERLRRMSLAASELEVKGTRKFAGSNLSGQGDNILFEDANAG